MHRLAEGNWSASPSAARSSDSRRRPPWSQQRVSGFPEPLNRAHLQRQGGSREPPRGLCGAAVSLKRRSRVSVHPAGPSGRRRFLRGIPFFAQSVGPRSLWRRGLRRERRLSRAESRGFVGFFRGRRSLLAGERRAWPRREGGCRGGCVSLREKGFSLNGSKRSDERRRGSGRRRSRRHGFSVAVSASETPDSAVALFLPPLSRTASSHDCVHPGHGHATLQTTPRRNAALRAKQARW